MLGLEAEGFHLPFLKIVGGGKGIEASGLEVALVIDMTPEAIKDPLNGTRIGKERETILERQSVS